MSKFSKVAAAVLAVAMLAPSVNVASAAFVTPKKAAMLINNPNLGGCAAVIKLNARVVAKSKGQVIVRLQRKSDMAIAPLGVVNVVDNPNYGKKKGLYNWEKFMGKANFNYAPPRLKDKIRTIASGPGKVVYSKWVPFVRKC